LYREQGNVKPKRVGSTRKSQLEDYKEEVKKMVAEYQLPETNQFIQSEILR
jgi:hypothetical protein